MTGLVLLCVFALLVCDATAGLASRLARSLAFATAAVLCALAKVTGFQCFDVLHKIASIKILIFIDYNMACVQSQH